VNCVRKYRPPRFLKKSVIASTGAALGLSFEEKALSAKTARKSVVPVSEGSFFWIISLYYLE